MIKLLQLHEEQKNSQKQQIQKLREKSVEVIKKEQSVHREKMFSTNFLAAMAFFDKMTHKKRNLKKKIKSQIF